MALTASTFGCLDHDESERRRLMDVFDLFRDAGTLDELGIGTIRDTFAEHFFPGTNTSQSYARTFLFIHWLYAQFEGGRVPSRRVEGYAREPQWRLVQRLQAGGAGASKGVIGIEAGEHLQRLLSAIYWQGLRRWGIRLFEGFIDRYHASLDRHRWVIERTFAWLNRYRRLTVRYERRADIHQGFLTLGCCLICFNALQPGM